MTDSSSSRVAARRAATKRQILDAAWAVMAEEGIAALSAREVARSVGMRQQSLTYYFPTKQDLLDALFADGFADFHEALAAVPDGPDPVEAVVTVAEAVVGYFTTHPARYHLMFQRTVPGFSPSADSHDAALRCLAVLTDRLASAGVTDPGSVGLVRGLISGLASEQLANDPDGRQFTDQVGHGIRALLAAPAIRPG
jgi:AcrR family transcriptional regulator